MFGNGENTGKLPSWTLKQISLLGTWAKDSTMEQNQSEDTGYTDRTLITIHTPPVYAMKEIELK